MQIELYPGLIDSLYQIQAVISLVYLQLYIMYKEYIYQLFFIASQLLFLILDFIFFGNILHYIIIIGDQQVRFLNQILGFFRFNFAHSRGDTPEPEGKKAKKPNIRTNKMNMEKDPHQDPHHNHKPDATFYPVISQKQEEQRSSPISVFIEDPNIPIQDNQKRRFEFLQSQIQAEKSLIRSNLPQEWFQGWSYDIDQVNKVYRENSPIREYYPEIINRQKEFRVEQIPLRFDTKQARNGDEHHQILKAIRFEEKEIIKSCLPQELFQNDPMFILSLHLETKEDPQINILDIPDSTIIFKL